MDLQEKADRARQRVKKCDDQFLADWLNSALSGMQHHLDQYRMTGEVAHLHEIALGDITLAAVVAELIIRQEAKRQESLV